MHLTDQSDLDSEYWRHYLTPSLYNGDCSAFHQHMPTLRLLCTGKRIVELGVRYGVSTLAILAAHPRKLTSYDIDRKETVDNLVRLAQQENIEFSFIMGNSLRVEIPQCDVLFIDTMHNYSQLLRELFLHGNSAKEYIIMHDTVSFGSKDEFPDGSAKQGLIAAIVEWLGHNKHWSVAAQYKNNNGLTILRRL